MVEDNKISDTSLAGEAAHHAELSKDDFARLGMPLIVYVTLVEEDGVDAFQLNSADGQAIGLFESRAEAIGVALQNSLTPLTVH